MSTVIYPAELNTDKKKLFACYALHEQMRLEHNSVAENFRSRLTLESVPENAKELEAKKKQGFIRPWCPEGFMLADTPENNSLRAKYRSYAHESKARQKQLLAERNQLIESIRWANYTPEQWKAVSKLDQEGQIAIYKALFGDKNIEKVKPTKATSPVLDELKALNLDDMPETLGSDPTEDFTTYTEVDEGSDVTKTADRITYTGAETNYFTYYVYKDKGAGHFDGNFEHLEKHFASAIGDGLSINSWMLANALGDENDLRSGSQDMLHYKVYWHATWDHRFYLGEMDGSSYYFDFYNGGDINTVYYAEIERDEDVGTYGTLYSYPCTSDYYDDGGDLVDTLSLVLHTSKKDFRYIYGLAGYDIDSSSGVIATGYVELLDLQEAVPITLELRSSSDIDVRIVLDTGISLALRSSSDTRADLVLTTEVSFALRSSSDTRAVLTLDAEITLELRSSADIRVALVLDTLIILDLRSSTDTRVDIIIKVAPVLELRSSTDTHAAINLETGITLALRFASNTRAALALSLGTVLMLRSSADTRAALVLLTIISLGLRSSSATRAAIILQVAPLLELRSFTDPRAALQLSTLITLALLSQTATRVALALTVEIIIRHQDIIMTMHNRTLTMAMSSRTMGMKVRQDE